METIITRDTDVIREYLSAMDARERGLSPFARLAATVKLARLKRELSETQIESTDEDLQALRREIDERLDRTLLRRLAASTWGARLLLVLMLVGFQQALVLLCWLATSMFEKFAPRPAWWNPLLPHEEPVSLYVFIFLFFLMPPLLAVIAFFSGRFFRVWRVGIPLTLAILLLSSIFTFWVIRREVKVRNPIAEKSSLARFAKDNREIEVPSYEDWLKEHWLFSDTKFRRDYETYLRNGPGRWVTSRIGVTDAGWRSALPILGEYLDSGQDRQGFQEWVSYYLDRNRIYSEDRVEREAEAMTGEANQQHLGIWQVEPFLQERDGRLYRAYLGDVNRAMYKWGIVNVLVYALAFLFYYLLGPLLTIAVSKPRRLRHRQEVELVSEESEVREVRAKGGVERLKDRYFSFPERREIGSTPFYDAPFDLMAKAHRSYIRLVVFTSILVFAFWALMYGLKFHEDRLNAPSQTALMRSHLIFGGPADERPAPPAGGRAPAALPVKPDIEVRPEVGPAPSSPGDEDGEDSDSSSSSEERLNLRLMNLGALVDEHDYVAGKLFKEQMQTIQVQKGEIASLKSFTEQLQQSTSIFPGQVSEASSRASAAEARAGQIIGEVNAARQQAATIEQQLMAKLKDVENRASRAAEQVGKVEDQSSVLATRTEALEKELDRRARQIEARTEELGERTATLNEREERINRLQRVTFTVIIANLKGEVDDFNRRIDAGYYKDQPKTVPQRDAASLRDRIALMAKEFRDINTDLTRPFVTQLEELGRRLEQAAAKVR